MPWLDGHSIQFADKQPGKCCAGSHVATSLTSMVTPGHRMRWVTLCPKTTAELQPLSEGQGWQRFGPVCLTQDWDRVGRNPRHWTG